MKIYKFYLYISNSEREDLDIKCNKQTKYIYIENDDMCFVLYAWTDKKEYAKDFLRVRSNSFIMKEQKIDDQDEFHRFKIRYKEERLDLYKLQTYNNREEKYEEIKVLMTFDEHILFTEYIEERLSDILAPNCETEYMYFQDEYIDALDLILYTTYHDIFHAMDESVEDFASYQLGFGLTPNGNDVRKIYDSIDQFKLFVYTFKEFFK